MGKWVGNVLSISVVSSERFFCRKAVLAIITPERSLEKPVGQSKLSIIGLQQLG